MTRAAVSPAPLRLALAALALLLAAAGSARAQQAIGGYFTLVNTYFYAKAPHDGKRILVRPRQAFTVLDVTTDSQDLLWFQVSYPAEINKVTGIGWTAAAPHELLATPQEPVLVFTSVPGTDEAGLSVFKVPASGLELLNETQSGRPYAQVDWQKVRYQFDQPLRAWARGSAGIYRPGKSAQFLSRVYAELVTRNVDKDLQNRLLSGIIRIGDTQRDVRWALGDPLRTQQETIGAARHTIWQFPELTVTFENEVVKQFN